MSAKSVPEDDAKCDQSASTASFSTTSSSKGKTENFVDSELARFLAEEESLDEVKKSEEKAEGGRVDSDDARLLNGNKGGEAARIAARIAERRVRSQRKESIEPVLEVTKPVETSEQAVDSILLEYREQEEPPFGEKRKSLNNSSSEPNRRTARKASSKASKLKSKNTKADKRKKAEAAAILLVPAAASPIQLKRSKRRWGILPRRKKTPRFARAVDSIATFVAKNKKRAEKKSREPTSSNALARKRGRSKDRKKSEKEKKKSRSRSRSLEKSESFTPTKKS